MEREEGDLNFFSSTWWVFGHGWGGGRGGNGFRFVFQVGGCLGMDGGKFLYFFSKRVEPWARLWDRGERFSWLTYGS